MNNFQTCSYIYSSFFFFTTPLGPARAGSLGAAAMDADAAGTATAAATTTAATDAAAT